MGMVNDTFMKEFIGPNYTPSMNSMKETYAELTGDLYHVQRFESERDDITKSNDKPFAYLDKAHADKLLVRDKDGELQFTVFATDLCFWHPLARKEVRLEYQCGCAES
jgi:hypothetical protein